MIYIGIDPGVETGIAVWDSEKKTLIEVTSWPLHYALLEVISQWNTCKLDEVDIKVRVEDARLRKWVTGGRERLQGAGSVKRDCKIWEDLLTDYNIPFEMVAPKNNRTKLSAESFKKMTGWQGRTNEHGRDAAMLCWKL